MQKLPLEGTFNEFVQAEGGELIERLLPNNDSRKRADYLFRSPLVIAELKCLERDIDMREHAEKLNARIADWRHRGLIRVYGTAQIELRKLPKVCQDEWIDLYEAPIQSQILRDANRQIREAKEALNFPDAKGVVLIANECREFPSPPDLFTFIARIFKKKKPDGQPLFSSVHSVVIFSVNMLIASPDYPAGRLAWFNAYRGKGDDAVNAFLHNFGDSWLKFCSAKRGNTHVAVKLTREQIEALQFIKPRFE